MSATQQFILGLVGIFAATLVGLAWVSAKYGTGKKP